MPKFQYSILDVDGKLQTGVISASNREKAISTVSKENVKLVSLKEQGAGKAWWQQNISFSGGLTQKDIILITKRIATMTGKGFSVIDSLRSIELQTQSPGLKEIIQDIMHKVELGNSLSEALKDYPEAFSSVYTSIVKVGEESGSLDEVLSYLEKQETQMYELKKKALSAMTYPAIIVVIMVLICVGMIIFLIPFLRDLFSSFEAQLPWSTQMLMKAEPFLKSYWWAIIGALIAFFFGGKFILKNQSIQRLLDNVLLRIPLVGKLVKTYNVAQFVRTFATLIQSGVPMSQSLEILTTVPNNSLYKHALENIQQDVNKGSIFSAALGKYNKLFPELVIESIKLGEKTGNLSDSTAYLAELYEEDLKETLQTLTTLIQPLLLVLVGAMVAAFALSVITPLQQLPQLIQEGA